MRYPIDPGFAHGSDTSEEAAHSIAGHHVATQRAEVLRLFAEHHLLTADEVGLLTGWTSSAPHARCSELIAQGWLVKTNQRRLTRYGRNATVMRLADNHPFSLTPRGGVPCLST